MKQNLNNAYYFSKYYGLFIGKLSENVTHKHYALQLSISLNENMVITIGENSKKVKAFFLSSNVVHQLIAKGLHLTLLINPISPIGHFLQSKFSGDFTNLTDSFAENLRNHLSYLQMGKITFIEFITRINSILDLFKFECEQDSHVGDDRIVRAIKYLDENFERVISLEEIAEQCHLSTSRFLHLFREKTNLNFRRYQLWNRLIKSLPSLTQTSITATAHQFGFTDSSHYTRTFKETFGVTPKFLIHKK